MNLITKQILLQRLPKAWLAQYGRHTLGIYDALLAEGGKLTEARAAEIIGNDSWTCILCDECGQSVEVAVTVGQEPDYDSSTATICLACLTRAVSLASVPTPPSTPL